MSTATKGRAFEHDVRKMLEANGYAVTRGAGSKGFFDTPQGKVKCDLIASKCGTGNRYDMQIIVIQCKTRAF